MSEAESFEPKIIAYVCNWCTYLGADLAGTNRLEYPANIRVVRLPCTGRIDFNLLIKAFEMGADAVLVSGCHPGDCHYTAGNYHARRRWMLFRHLLEAIGIESQRVHFTWISAAEGKKWQHVVEELTAETRKLGPYLAYREIVSDDENSSRHTPCAVRQTLPASVSACGSDRRADGTPPASGYPVPATLTTLRDTCRQLLRDGKVDVVIGYGRDPVGEASNSPLPGHHVLMVAGEGQGVRADSVQAESPGHDAPAVPVFIRRPEDADQLVWNDRCHANLTVYLKRPEIRALGRPAIVVKGCDQRALVVLEKEAQLDRAEVYVIGMACDGMGRPKCDACDVHQPRGTDVVIGEAAVGNSADSKSADAGLAGSNAEKRYAAINAFLARPSAERLAYWRQELARCVKCYACRQVCPMCYCPRCIVDKNRPQAISTSATLKGNFAWHITRAFHLAARCVGCEECARVCPAGIDLRLLNLSLAQAAEENFAFRAGNDPQAEPVVGAYALQDKEGFIQ